MMRTLWILLAALAVIPAAQAAYKCTDEKGRTHVGDTPPPGCDRVIMYEVTRSGTVIRKIDPTPTEQEKQARIDEEARKKEAARAADEQRRKDLALLATYSSEKDFDVSRDRNIDPVQNRIKGAKERSEAVDKRIKELEEEMEFYKAGKSKAAAGKTREAPPQLTTDLERAKKERAQLATNLASYDKEIDQIKVRYETDKKRWLDLKQMHREGRLDLRDPREIEAAAKKQPQPATQTRRYNLYLVPAN
jgi:chromosome segregation ATPase